MFSPLSTERLLIRSARPSDVDALVERRNDAEVAEFQDWDVPCEHGPAEQLLAGAAAMTGPAVGDWWMATIADRADTRVLGDFNIRLDVGGVATVGYALARSSWGHGYAAEALTVVVGWLFDDVGVDRVDATVHPENLRSLRLLESCGFVFEGLDRNTMWDRHGRVDDHRYSLTPQLREEWGNRPTHKPATVELVEPYPNGLRHVLALRTHRSQERFVAPIAVSLAQVAVPPFEEGFAGNPGDPRAIPWPRIVHADGQAVGFVMCEAPTPANPEPYLWRLLIDRMHQRRGIGKRVIELVFDQARAWGSESISVSWVPGVGSPEPLYLAMGFEPTGEIDDGEIVGRARLA